MKTKNTIIFLLILAVLITACVPVTPNALSAEQQTATALAQEQPTETVLPVTETKIATAPSSSTKTITPTATRKPLSADVVGPDEFPEGVNPLTGLEVDDPTLLQRRPVIMKVSNVEINKRPHWGLSSADIVFEYYIGFGGSRYSALYYGQDADKIGPIRSIRRVDGHLGSLYKAVVGSTGGDPVDVLPYLDELIPGRFFLNNNLCPGVCDDGRDTVSSVFGDSAALSEYFNKRGYDLEDPDLTGMAFSETPPEGGETAESVWVVWSDRNRANWVYDPETGKYLNFSISESTNYQYKELIDQNTREQLAFSNVIVLTAPYTRLKETLHNIDLIGNATGYDVTIFRDGQAYQVFWKTPQRDKPIQFLDAEGNPFHLQPGNTWITIFGQTSPTVVEDDEWTITFNMP